MGKITKQAPVKLIVGFIFKDKEILKKAEGILKRRFGKSDFESRLLRFHHTDYYEKELGRGLKRKFISFKKPIFPESLPEIKILTNKIEKKLSQRDKRLINIDPGYLDLAKLVLATTKDYFHRIYLNKGIYAEITLYFRHKCFRPWEWTYPDYKTQEYISIFNKIRGIYVGR